MRPSEVRGELTEAAQRIALLAADPAWIAGLSNAERRSVGKVLSGAREVPGPARNSTICSRPRAGSGASSTRAKWSTSGPAPHIASAA